MTLIGDIKELTGDKDATIAVVLCAAFLLVPTIIFLAIYFPLLIQSYDPIKILLISIVGGVATIFPTFIAVAATMTSVESLKLKDTDSLSMFAFIASAILVIPLEILLLTLAYFINIQLKLTFLIYIAILLFIPMMCVYRALRSYTDKKKDHTN